MYMSIHGTHVQMIYLSPVIMLIRYIHASVRRYGRNNIYAQFFIGLGYIYICGIGRYHPSNFEIVV